MIYVNGQQFQMTRFPDNTKGCLDFNISSRWAAGLPTGVYDIDWRYNQDDELSTLIFITRHLQQMGHKVNLNLGYVPNARMDRVKHESEIFTLKHFCEVINWLHFEHVYILDPHSNVTPALLDRVVMVDPMRFIAQAIIDARNTGPYKDKNVVLFFPDEGAKKRYHDGDHVCFFGSKVRDWETGNIEGLRIMNDTNIEGDFDILKSSTVLIIDDIISGGGTVYYSIKELMKHGVTDVCVYCTHLENTMFMQEDNKLRQMLMGPEKTPFRKLYSTDSIHHNGIFSAMTHEKKGKVEIFSIGNWQTPYNND